LGCRVTGAKDGLTENRQNERSMVNDKLLKNLSVRKNFQRISLLKICSLRGICRGIGLLEKL
jgi:hypothetical protein